MLLGPVVGGPVAFNGSQDRGGTCTMAWSGRSRDCGGLSSSACPYRCSACRAWGASPRANSPEHPCCSWCPGEVMVVARCPPRLGLHPVAAAYPLRHPERCQSAPDAEEAILQAGATRNRRRCGQACRRHHPASIHPDQPSQRRCLPARSIRRSRRRGRRDSNRTGQAPEEPR